MIHAPYKSTPNITKCFENLVISDKRPLHIVEENVAFKKKTARFLREKHYILCKIFSFLNPNWSQKILAMWTSCLGSQSCYALSLTLRNRFVA